MGWSTTHFFLTKHTSALLVKGFRPIHVSPSKMDTTQALETIMEGEERMGKEYEDSKYEETNSMKEAVKMSQEGICEYGPFWDHVLEYWNKRLKNKDRIFFLEYEDLKEDFTSQSIKLVDFLGLSFSEEEKKRGVIEDISKLCSFKNLKELDVNKGEGIVVGIPNSAFFRKGEVGDWVNHLSPAMVEKIKKLVEEKFKDSGVTFKMISER
ncbi:unnamed protein product [Thlaspi arvense]|uniref:Sulfotransferase n=1 Tax=Thlaspi arvense TaxID=13288 RepID=A0AAU9TCA6_THLAR|nr:unnamed protein product [Thlaspi arvense]